MKVRFLLSLSFLTLLSLSGCFEKDSDKDPKPDQPKNFTGCRLVKVTSTNEFSKGGTDQISLVYYYDNENRIIKKDEVSKAGAVVGSSTYTYDSQGKLILEEGDTNTKIQLIYDSAGKLIEKRRYSSGTSLVSNTIIYTYNALDQVNSMKSYNHGTGTPQLQWGYTYKFFPDGNLKEQNSFLVRANGVIDTLNQPYHHYISYDNYKNPYAQSNFTLKQAEPVIATYKNNATEKLYSSGGNPTRFHLLYKYNSDSLVTEQISVENDVKTEFFYDCN